MRRATSVVRVALYSACAVLADFARDATELRRFCRSNGMLVDDAIPNKLATLGSPAMLRSGDPGRRDGDAGMQKSVTKSRLLYAGLAGRLTSPEDSEKGSASSGTLALACKVLALARLASLGDGSSKPAVLFAEMRCRR